MQQHILNSIAKSTKLWSWCIAQQHKNKRQIHHKLRKNDTINVKSSCTYPLLIQMLLLNRWRCRAKKGRIENSFRSSRKIYVSSWRFYEIVNLQSQASSKQVKTQKSWLDVPGEKSTNWNLCNLFIYSTPYITILHFFIASENCIWPTFPDFTLFCKLVSVRQQCSSAQHSGILHLPYCYSKEWRWWSWSCRCQRSLNAYVTCSFSNFFFCFAKLQTWRV